MRHWRKGSLTGRSRSTVAQLDRWGMTALGQWMGRGGRRSGRGAVRYMGGANGGGGWTGPSPEWAGDGAFFSTTATGDDLGASVVDPMWELPGARPNKLVMRAAPLGGLWRRRRHSTQHRAEERGSSAAE
jgi:hypothetical protein